MLLYLFFCPYLTVSRSRGEKQPCQRAVFMWNSRKTQELSQGKTILLSPVLVLTHHLRKLAPVASALCPGWALPSAEPPWDSTQGWCWASCQPCLQAARQHEFCASQHQYRHLLVNSQIALSFSKQQWWRYREVADQTVRPSFSRKHPDLLSHPQHLRVRSPVKCHYQLHSHWQCCSENCLAWKQPKASFSCTVGK